MAMYALLIIIRELHGFRRLLKALKQEPALYPGDASGEECDNRERAQQEISAETFLKLLDDLQDRLDSFEREAIDRMLQDLFRYDFRGEPVSKLLAQVRDKTEIFDFIGAEEEVQKLKEGLR